MQNSLSPQFWFSWRHQLKAFSDDYHVVAVDLRGYNQTERPPRVRDYVLATLRQDVAQLIPALGHQRATLVAHDWGAVIAWAVTQHHPELVEKLVVMNCPHPRLFQHSITSNWSQLMKSWYVFLFQVPRLPEFLLSYRDYGYFSAVFRGRKGGVKNLSTFPKEEVEAYKYVFSQPNALSGPLNFYRCIFNDPAEYQHPQGNIDTPTLILWGDDDPFLGMDMANAHAAFATDLTVRHFPNCSHWVQHERSEEVNQYIKDFL